MAVTKIAHKPNLNAVAAMEIFRNHFDGKYKVNEFKGLFRDFVVEKNPWVGVGVRLEQSDGQTKFNYNGMCPKWWARALLGPLFGIFLWNGITGEVRQFIENAPEFH